MRVTSDCVATFYYPKLILTFCVLLRSYKAPTKEHTVTRLFCDHTFFEILRFTYVTYRMFF